jgi:hypothetical protein
MADSECAAAGRILLEKVALPLFRQFPRGAHRAAPVLFYVRGAWGKGHALLSYRVRSRLSTGLHRVTTE